jgi:hypothetical protein
MNNVPQLFSKIAVAIPENRRKNKNYIGPILQQNKKTIILTYN